VVQDVYARYEEAAAKKVDIEITSDSDTALDLFQQARKRCQQPAATSASITRGRKRTKLTSEFDEFMARANKADLSVEDPLEWWVHHAPDYSVLFQDGV
jgi:uncharacterized protein YacL (UPF0231 family)